MPVVYTVLGVLLWPVPLLGLLHAESSAVVAAVAYFASGLSSISLFQRRHGLTRTLLRQIGVLVIPLALLTVTLLWRPNCDYATGLLFFLLFALPTVVFAVGLAYALDRWTVQWRRTWFVGIGIAVCVIGPLYDIGFHPQFYTYNHVFGGILGPVYDEELAVRPGLFVFRGLTLAWAALFMLLGLMGEERQLRRRSAKPVLHAAAPLVIPAVIIAAYVFAVDLGFNTTLKSLREALPGRLVTQHFEIHYDPETLSEIDLQVIADEHEFRYHELAGSLGVDVSGRIRSFIYPDPEVRADLTGARYTNVAPVWLSVPQTHVLASEVAGVFPHELAHVFSREFGLPILNASLAVGLVEGLAVALQPPSGLPTPHEQVSATLLSKMYAEGSHMPTSEAGARDLAIIVASHLSPAGFWTGRGAVSYTTMGSFVRYLLDAYGAEAMKEVYATGNFRKVYGKPLARLTLEWTTSLLTLPAVATSSGPLAAARFAVPSLFEKRCPHYLPPYRADYRDATIALARGDSAQALHAAVSSLDHEPRYFPSLDIWARLMLAEGREEEVRARIEPHSFDSLTAGLLVRLGDSRALTGDSSGARTAYDRALDRLPSFAHEDASRIHIRRLAAARPEITRPLVDGGAPPPGDDPLVAMARSLYHARLQRYEQAAEVLRKTPHRLDDPSLTRAGAETLRRRRLVWLARFHHRAGAHTAASTYAEQAAGSYRTAGAFNEAAHLDNYGHMMRWLASSSVVVSSSTSSARSAPAPSR